MPRAEAEALVPLSHHADYIAEKTGARPGDGVRSPDPAQPGRRRRRRPVRPTRSGRRAVPGDGHAVGRRRWAACAPRTRSWRRRSGPSVCVPGEAIVLDTQAGVEHFGRALARGFGHAIVVTDPTYSGIGVALAAARLARDLGIPDGSTSRSTGSGRPTTGAAHWRRSRRAATASSSTAGRGCPTTRRCWPPNPPSSACCRSVRRHSSQRYALCTQSVTGIPTEAMA